MPSAVILLAGGNGNRMGHCVEDKILLKLNNKTVLEYSLDTFIHSQTVEQYIIVYKDENQLLDIKRALKINHPNLEKFTFTPGGKERQNSVYNGLSVINEQIQHVFIHDCARPLIDVEQLKLLQQSMVDHNAATLAHKVTDTIKQIAERPPLKNNAFALKDLQRDLLWAIETPQIFNKKTILSGYDYVNKNNSIITDDTSAVSAIGEEIFIIENKKPNPKITYPQDLDLIKFLNV